MVSTLNGIGRFHHIPKKLNLYMKNRESPPAKPSIDGPLKLEQKILPSYLGYVLLGQNNTLSVTIIDDLNEEQIEALISVLRHFKRAIGWTIHDIIGIHMLS